MMMMMHGNDDGVNDDSGDDGYNDGDVWWMGDEEGDDDGGDSLDWWLFPCMWCMVTKRLQ